MNSTTATIAINGQVDPSDREVLFEDFNKRLGNLPFGIQQNDNGELAVFPAAKR
jgi:hypothetical protein